MGPRMSNAGRSFVHLSLLVLSLVVAGCGGAGPSDAHTDAVVSCAGNVGPWTPGTGYAAGALVSFQGAVYRCVQGHTALDGWMPSVVPALWQHVTCAGGGPPP